MHQQIRIRTQWDLSHLGIDENNILTHLKEVSENVDAFVEKWKNRSDYLENPNILRVALDDYEKLMRYYGTAGKANYFVLLSRALDRSNPTLKALEKKVINEDQRDALVFFQLSISKIPKDKRNEFLQSETLKPYKHYLEKLFAQADYILSEKEEQIINLFKKSSYFYWVDMMEALLGQEERYVLTRDGKRKLPLSQIVILLSDNDKATRESAAKALNNIQQQYVDIAERVVNAILQYAKINDELRGFDRPDRDRLLAGDIETDVIDTLLESVRRKYYISRRYYELKARLLGVEKITSAEYNVEYGSTGTKYTYEQSFTLVKNVLQNLDEEFGDILEMYNQNGQIDVYPKKGKDYGAFCVHNLLNDPTYILLNHNNRLSDVLTFAHEVGHGIHNELSKKTQNALNFEIPTSTAEVASTFMEDFVFPAILKEANDEERLAIIMSKLNDEISTIFPLVALYTLEQDLHNAFRKEGYLSSQRIGELFVKNMRDYMGDAVLFDKYSQNGWLYWFKGYYWYIYKSYSYAIGRLISKALQRRVKNNPKEINKVKVFLSSGSSNSPKAIFNDIGIDISDKRFWDEGLTEVEDLLNEAENLARKLRKI
jgi:oligoendopeptidase F